MPDVKQFSDDEMFEMELIAQNEGKSVRQQMLERSGENTNDHKLYDQQGVGPDESLSPEEGGDSANLNSTPLPKLVEAQQKGRARQEKAQDDQDGGAKPAGVEPVEKIDSKR